MTDKTTSAQRDKAEQRMEQSRTTAAALREQLGDPEDVVDHHGFFPADRRGMNLDSYMSVWRHPMLRELHESKQRKRFNALLAMRPVDPTAMCSECQAPSQWHEYVISLCLFRATPEPDSQAETIARLMPGWWNRCAASSAYQIEHVWGGSSTLPNFDGAQWAAILPPTLKAIFAPDPPKPRKSRRAAQAAGGHPRRRDRRRHGEVGRGKDEVAGRGRPQRSTRRLGTLAANLTGAGHPRPPAI